MADITDTPATEPTLFIDGAWRNSSDGRSRASINPFNATVISHVSEATAKDAEESINVASKFLRSSDWSRKTFKERALLLLAIADLLQRDREKLAHVEVLDTGKTLVEAETDVDDVTAVFRFYAEEGENFETRRRIKGEGIPSSVESYITKEAVGVCVLIAPWNYPLLQICWKLAPALLAGNVCIIKPSEVTPLTTIHLVKIMVEAGVPPQAVQLLTAGGASVGPTLTTHEDVDLVSFTGGLETGKKVLASAASTIKRTCVELGGKNPNILFADVPLDWAIDNVITAVFLHSGQVCSSGARLIVEESIADKLVAGVVERAKLIRMGNGMDPASETGPLVSALHLSKMADYMALARKEGAKVLCGGSEPDRQDPAYAHLPKDGYFFLPTVLDGCDRSMQIVQLETFGPILTVERFKDGDEEQAIYLANDTKYGLAGGVQTQDRQRALRVLSRLRHGTIWNQTYGSYTPRAEWGGFGLSGNGRELGKSGLDEYVETKHIYIENEPAKADWFKGLPHSAHAKFEKK